MEPIHGRANGSAEHNGDEEKKEVSTTLRKLRTKFDNINKLVKEKERELEVDSKKFLKPNFEQVRDYCVERKNGIDPQRFLDYYESIGWKIGNKPMKSWQAAIRTWENKNRENSGGSVVEPPKKVFMND